MTIFRTRAAEEWMGGREKPARHGLPWSMADYAALCHGFDRGDSLSRLCIDLQRSPSGVIPKLVQKGLIEMCSDGEYHRVKNKAEFAAPRAWTQMAGTPHDDVIDSLLSTFPKLLVDYHKETTMAPTIETKTFIQGTDAATLSDDQILAKIANIEAEAKKWDGLQNRPKTLDTQVARLKADAKALAEFIDTRNAAKPA